MTRRYLVALALLTACGDNGTGPDGFDADAYVGTWELQIDALPDCWEATTLRFVIDQEDADAQVDGSMNVVTYWWFGSGPPSSTANAVTGNVNEGRNTFGIMFWKVFGAGEFEGTAVTTDEMAGTFSDPNGVWNTTEPGRGGCKADAVAAHVSDKVP